MLYTVSAVQILVTVDALDELGKNGNGGTEKVGKCTHWPARMSLTVKEADLVNTVVIANLQDQDTGTFAGDEWGETDTRFLFGALNALSLLHLMDLVDLPKAIAHVQACANFDGGYGVSPGAESHAGQVYTCVGALAIAGRLDLVDKDRLGGWLSERQLDNGGLNGRPEKLEDVCYSWWVMSSLAMIGRLHWIDGEKLTSFILRCQVLDPPLCPVRCTDHGRTPKWVVLLIDLAIWLMYFTPCLVLRVSACLSIQVWSMWIPYSESMLDALSTRADLITAACLLESLSVPLVVEHQKTLGSTFSIPFHV